MSPCLAAQIAGARGSMRRIRGFRREGTKAVLFATATALETTDGAGTIVFMSMRLLRTLLGFALICRRCRIGGGAELTAALLVVTGRRSGGSVVTTTGRLRPPSSISLLLLTVRRIERWKCTFAVYLSACPRKAEFVQDYSQCTRARASPCVVSIGTAIRTDRLRT